MHFDGADMLRCPAHARVSNRDNQRGRRDVSVARWKISTRFPWIFPLGRGLRAAEGSCSAQPAATVRELLHLFYSSSS